MLSSEATLNYLSSLLLSEVAAGAAAKTPVEQKIYHIQNCCTNEEAAISPEVKAAVREMVRNEWSTVVKQFLDDILGTLIQNEKSSI